LFPLAFQNISVHYYFSFLNFMLFFSYYSIPGNQSSSFFFELWLQVAKSTPWAC